MNEVSRDDKGRIIITFGNPIYVREHRWIFAFFGSVKGIDLLVAKDKVLAVRFDTLEVLTNFAETRGWPDLDEVLACLQDFDREVWIPYLRLRGEYRS